MITYWSVGKLDLIPEERGGSHGIKFKISDRKSIRTHAVVTETTET